MVEEKEREKETRMRGVSKLRKTSFFFLKEMTDILKGTTRA